MFQRGLLGNHQETFFEGFELCLHAFVQHIISVQVHKLLIDRKALKLLHIQQFNFHHFNFFQFGKTDFKLM